MRPMALAAGVWLCTLPFVFVLLAPWAGGKAAGGAALALLVVIAGICWSLCSFKYPHHLDQGGRRP